MKIAFFMGGAPANYVEDLLLAGLLAHLGPDNVAYSPHKDHFGAVRPARYPERTCWTPNLPVALPDSALMEYADGADLVVVGYPEDGERAGVLSEACARFGDKAVLVNGEDGVVWRILHGLLPGRPWFVREVDSRGGCPYEGQPISPLPLCFNTIDLPAVHPWEERDIPILWVGAAHKHRKTYIDALRAVEGAMVVTDSVPHAEYSELLSRTRLAVVLHGVGPQSYRLFEVIAHGCDVLCQVVKNIWIEDVQEFDSVDHFRGLLEGYRGRYIPELRRDLLIHHTHLARASHFLSRIP